VPEHDDHDGAKVFYRILKASYPYWFGTVPGDANHEKIPEPLIEHDLRWNPAIRAT
jgi:hypothetical protein